MLRNHFESSTTSHFAPRKLALRSAVEEMNTVTDSLENRLAAMEASINTQATSLALVEAAVVTLTEALHTMIEKLSKLTQRFESWTTNTGGRPTPICAAARATCIPSGSRSHRSTGLR